MRSSHVFVVFPLPILLLFALIPAAAQTAPLLTAKDREQLAQLQREISAAEMEKILTPFNRLDRVSGSEGEARAADSRQRPREQKVC